MLHCNGLKTFAVTTCFERKDSREINFILGVDHTRYNIQQQCTAGPKFACERTGGFAKKILFTQNSRNSQYFLPIHSVFVWLCQFCSYHFVCVEVEWDFINWNIVLDFCGFHCLFLKVYLTHGLLRRCLGRTSVRETQLNQFYWWKWINVFKLLQQQVQLPHVHQIRQVRMLECLIDSLQQLTDHFFTVNLVSKIIYNWNNGDCTGAASCESCFWFLKLFHI